jgi:hypothetical protein
MIASLIFLIIEFIFCLAKAKRKKFAELRAKHYNMKEAFRLGHKLVEEDVDEEEDSNAVLPNDDDSDNDNEYNNYSTSSNNGIIPMET